MKNLNFILVKRLATAVASCAIVLLIGCDNDKPTGSVKPKEYPFYISNTYPRELQIFHPTTHKIDSISIPWDPYPGVTVSADGQRLYIAQGNSVVVVDADSLTLVTELFYLPEQPVIVSPDNRLIAITGNDLSILRTVDYSLVFSDSAVTGNGSFTSDSKNFYYSSRTSMDTGYFMNKVNLSDSLFPVTRKAIPGNGVGQVVPSVDETKWFLYRSVALWTYAFEVYDVINDSIIFREILAPGAGSIAISPDGKFAFYTNPGSNAIVLPQPDYSFTIFDIYTNSIDTVIKAPEYFSDTGWGGPPNLLSVSPDGKTLGILGGNLANIAFYVFDIERKELIFRSIPDSQVSAFINISVQSMK